MDRGDSIDQAPLLPAKPSRLQTSEGDTDETVPVYWILVIALYNIPLGLMNVCVNTILLPPLIKDVVGDKNKEAALGFVTALCSAIHVVEPFLGAASDRARCSFRKRFFIILGQSCTCCGVAGFWFVDRVVRADGARQHHLEWRFLVMAYFMLHLGNMIGWIPYTAVIPEMPASQRGQAAGIIGVVAGGCMYAGSVLGFLIGQKYIGNDAAFLFMLVLNICNIPIGCLAVQGSPGTWSRPFRSERAAPPLSAEDAGKTFVTILRERLVSPSKLWAMVREFFSAFRESPAYSRNFLRSFVGTLNPFGTFIFYWCKLFTPAALAAVATATTVLVPTQRTIHPCM